MNVHHIVRENGNFEFKDTEVDINTIIEFGISIRKSYKRNGDFKKFYKVGYIRLNNGSLIDAITDISFIKELKQRLKGKYTGSHDKEITYKKTKYGYEERSAVSWQYKLK